MPFQYLFILMLIGLLSHLMCMFPRQLCDTLNTGKLNVEQFALAMHFVQQKVTAGLNPPPTLTLEMVPPSMRLTVSYIINVGKGYFFYRFIENTFYTILLNCRINLPRGLLLFLILVGCKNWIR